MKTVSICVGHSREGDDGAVSVSGESEWNYNEPVAEILADILRRAGVKVYVHDMYPGKDYSTAMSLLSRALDVENPDCALELHFNSATPNAEGFEYLYWESSQRGRKLAEALQRNHAQTVPDQRNRSTKAVQFGQNGSLFLRSPMAPCVICEGFFGSSDKEWKRFGSEAGQSLLAEIYAAGICEFLGVSLVPQRPEDGSGEAARKKRDEDILERTGKIRVELDALEALIRTDAE